MTQTQQTKTFTNRSNAARAARQALAGKVNSPLQGVHFKVEPHPTDEPGGGGEVYTFTLIDTHTGEQTPGEAINDETEINTPHEHEAPAEDLGVDDPAGDPFFEAAEEPTAAGGRFNPLDETPAPVAAEPKAKKARKAKAAGEPKEPKDSKRAQVLEMLARPEGATVEQIAAATAWLPHTIRAFVSTVPKKLGLTVNREKVDGKSVYKTTEAA